MFCAKSIKIVSFNCNSVRKNVDTIRELIDNYDIVCLQETFLSKNDTAFINGLRQDINFLISDCIYSENFNSGRPKCGLLMIWKTRFDHIFCPVITNYNYQAIKIKSVEGDVILFNAYMPYDDNSAVQLIHYREVLASLSNEIDNNPGCKINIVGDLNSDPKRPRLWREVSDFCNDYKLTIADHSLPNDTFTYLSPMHNTTSWLDHILSSVPDNISNISVLYDMNIYDHFPICFELEINLNPISSISYGVEPKLFVNWNQYNSGRENFIEKMDVHFAIHLLQSEVFKCNEKICDDLSHKLQINGLYAYLIDGLLTASDHMTHVKGHTFKQVPGWNDFCKNAHFIARRNFLKWKDDGMPRSGISYDLMKNSRADFRSALRICQENEQIIRDEKLVYSFQKKDFKSFWKQISVKQNSKVSCIDGINDDRQITDLFMKNILIF